MNDWQAGYTTIAEVAATLTGLLFVSVSVKLNSASDEERRWMLMVAKRSFYDFLAVLAIALLFLMPTVSPDVIAWAVLWLGVVRAVWHVNHWRTRRSLATLNMNLKDYVVPMVATLGLFIAGVATLLAWPIAGTITYLVAIALLFGACRNAWRLMTR
jgi:ABC-type phosphate/phosphonate transport system permease subunit